MKYLLIFMFAISACREGKPKSYAAVSREEKIALIENKEGFINVDRYKLVQLGSMRRDQYLLDTHSGRIWGIVCKSNSKGECSDSVLFQRVSVEGLSEQTWDSSPPTPEELKN